MAGSFFLIDLMVVMPDPKLTFHHRTAQKTRKLLVEWIFQRHLPVKMRLSAAMKWEVNQQRRGAQSVENTVRVDMVQASCNWGLPRAIQE